jgi:hypothetical protein
MRTFLILLYNISQILAHLISQIQLKYFIQASGASLWTSKNHINREGISTLWLRGSLMASAKLKYVIKIYGTSNFARQDFYFELFDNICRIINIF